MALHTRLSTVAICILGASTAAAQHLLLPFSQHSNIPAAPKLSARASSDQISLTSSQYAYVVNVSVGTPAQKLSLLISPSTGDTWVPDANTLECSPEWYYRRAYGSSYDDGDEFDPDSYNIPDPECKWGSYNKSLSSTYLRANARYDSFTAGYSDGTYASGTNVTDKLVVGNVELDDYPLGVASSASRWIGVLGLGYNDSGSYYSYSSSPEYPNFMDRIVSSGKIASPAYSIWLDDAQGTSGGLLFGAIDKSRFTGDLVRLDAYDSSYSSLYGFSTTINTINGTDAAGAAMPSIRSNDFPVDVNFGPGEVFSWLPELLADGIAETAGATFNSTLEYYTIPCDTTNSAKFVFELGGSGGPQLHVETADLVVPVTALKWGTRTTRYLNGTNTCLFGINKYYSRSSSSSSSSSYNYYNLGSSLLRRTYLVFDLANKEIAVAPVKFPSGSEKPSPTIVAFETYAATVPSASAFCTSSYCRSSSGGSGSGSRYGSGYGSSNSTDMGLEHWQQVAIGVGVSFGVLFLVAVILGILVCIRLRRKKAEGKEVEGGDAESAQEETMQQPAQMTENTAAAQNGSAARAPVLPPGNLPVIQERQEGLETAEPQTAAQGASEGSFRSFTPQLPALSTQLGRPISPPEPAATSNRASVAVSALSDEQPPEQQTQTHAHDSAPAPEAEPAPAAPASPKGKGKEVDRSAGEI